MKTGNYCIGKPKQQDRNFNNNLQLHTLVLVDKSKLMSALKFFFIASILGIGFFSCEKDDVASTYPSGERLKRMVRASDSMWYVSFQYDGQGRLVAIKDTNSQMHIGNRSILYDQQNRMIKMVSMRYYQSMSNPTARWTDSFAYDNSNRLIKKFVSSSTIPEPKIRNTYSYDAQGNLLVDTAYDYWSNTIWGYTKFTYDGSGNISQIERFEKNQNSVLESKRIDKAVYGAQMNPYKSAGIALYFFLYQQETVLSKNAIQQLQYLNGDKVDYTYDNLPNGLPGKVVAKYATRNYTHSTVTEFFY